MLILTLFAFIAGVVTVLSPCILPLLPIILSTADGSRQRPLGVVLGFVASFTFFTLFLSSLVRLTGIPADAMRLVSIVILAGFGLSLLIPSVQLQLEKWFSQLANFIPNQQGRSGLVGGLIVGLSLGLLWTPCVGPILASVISLALSGSVSAQAFVITLAYAVGTALPMFGVMLAGATALQKVPWLVANTGKIQKGFGVVMIATALAILLNLDRAFQTFILSTFPNYGTGLTKLEDRATVREQLQLFNQNPIDEDMLGKSTADMTQSKGVPAPELVPGGEWFNLPSGYPNGLRLADLRGKVVLVDFWTYSCINCQRTMPYLRSWWEKYEADGLVIIGVHSPEFEFEKDPANVKKALTDFQLTYPVMQDNNFATWRAYRNQYWPAKYLIDKDGQVRYTHFGEGAYDDTEAMIRKLLQETGAEVSQQVPSNPTYQTYSRTPETYLGYARMEYLASPERVVPDQQLTFTAPDPLPGNSFGFEGGWTVTSEAARPEVGARLYLNFNAKEVFLVARPTAEPVRMKVWLDGQVQALGADNQAGEVSITGDQLYKLINLASPGQHELQLEFPAGGVELFAFTFG